MTRGRSRPASAFGPAQALWDGDPGRRDLAPHPGGAGRGADAHRRRDLDGVAAARPVFGRCLLHLLREELPGRRRRWRSWLGRRRSRRRGRRHRRAKRRRSTSGACSRCAKACSSSGRCAACSAPPEVLIVDSTGRDHPRRCGLALQLGARLGLPTVGVTHRPLTATGEWPEDATRGDEPLAGRRRACRLLGLHEAGGAAACSARRLAHGPGGGSRGRARRHRRRPDARAAPASADRRPGAPAARRQRLPRRRADASSGTLASLARGCSRRSEPRARRRASRSSS